MIRLRLLVAMCLLVLAQGLKAGSIFFSSHSVLTADPWEVISKRDATSHLSVKELQKRANLKEEINQVIHRVIGNHGGSIIQKFRPEAMWLWKQWFGTVLYHASWMALRNMLGAVFFCVVMRKMIHGDFNILVMPQSSQINPDMLVRLKAIETIWQTLMSLTTFLLTFFVGQAYNFWRSFLDLGRSIQGRLQDINLMMATHATRRRHSIYTKEASCFLNSLAQQLRVFHLLFWASNAKNFQVLLTPQGLDRLVEVGYFPQAERERLDRLDLRSTQKSDAVLQSALYHCQEASQNPRIIDPAKKALFQRPLLTAFLQLRGSCASIPDLVDARMPLAYTHFVQILVDSFLMLAPMARYVDLGIFSVAFVGILTIFYQGLLDLAKVFLDPLDNEDYCEGCVYLDSAVFIREVNSASTRWMKAGEEIM